MKHLFKRFKGIIIFAFIEIFFFFVTKPNNLEAFFMIWGFIYLSLLLYNIFNINSDSSLMGIGGVGTSNPSQSNYGHSMGWLAERMYGTEKRKIRSGGGLFDSMNILYLLFLIINMIGYIIVMPK
jgi:hypothetical protein